MQAEVLLALFHVSLSTDHDTACNGNKRGRERAKCGACLRVRGSYHAFTDGFEVVRPPGNQHDALSPGTLNGKSVQRRGGMCRHTETTGDCAISPVRLSRCIPPESPLASSHPRPVAPIQTARGRGSAWLRGAPVGLAAGVVAIPMEGTPKGPAKMPFLLPSMLPLLSSPRNWFFSASMLSVCPMVLISLAASYGVGANRLQRSSIRAGSNTRHPMLYAFWDESGKSCRRRPHLSDGFLARPGSLTGRLHQPRDQSAPPRWKLA